MVQENRGTFGPSVSSLKSDRSQLCEYLMRELMSVTYLRGPSVSSHRFVLKEELSSSLLPLEIVPYGLLSIFSCRLLGVILFCSLDHLMSKFSCNL